MRDSIHVFACPPQHLAHSRPPRQLRMTLWKIEFLHLSELERFPLISTRDYRLCTLQQARHLVHAQEALVEPRRINQIPPSPALAARSVFGKRDQNPWLLNSYVRVNNPPSSHWTSLPPETRKSREGSEGNLCKHAHSAAEARIDLQPRLSIGELRCALGAGRAEGAAGRWRRISPGG